MKKYVLNVLINMIAFAGFAQQEATSLSPQQKLEGLKGTYEIQSNQRTYSLPSNLADIITENRDAAKRVVKKLNEETSVIIYPQSEIKLKDIEGK